MAAEFEACAGTWIEPTCQHATDEVGRGAKARGGGSAGYEMQPGNCCAAARCAALPRATAGNNHAPASALAACRAPSHPLLAAAKPLPESRKPPRPPCARPQARDAAKPSILSHLGAFEDALHRAKGGPSLLGEGRAATLADVAVACALLPLFQGVLGGDVRAAFPAVSKWLEGTARSEPFAAVMGGAARRLGGVGGRGRGGRVRAATRPRRGERPSAGGVQGTQAGHNWGQRSPGQPLAFAAPFRPVPRPPPNPPLRRRRPPAPRQVT